MGKYKFKGLMEWSYGKEKEFIDELYILIKNKKDMITCKDCKYYEPYNNKDYFMECKKIDGVTARRYYTETDICENFKPKSKDMKIKVKESVIMKYYELACEDVKADIRADFPEVFENELPKTWEEFCKIEEIPLNNAEMNLKEITNYHTFCGSDILVSQEFVKETKYTALRKLELLRDHYNDGWEPERLEKNYQIYRYNEYIDKNSFYNYRRFLSFKTQKLRDEFLDNFKDLIKSAEDLI